MNKNHICWITLLFIPLVLVSSVTAFTDIDTIHSKITKVEYEPILEKEYWDFENYSYFEFNFSVEIWNEKAKKQEIWIDEFQPGFNLQYQTEDTSLEMYIWDMINYPTIADAGKTIIQPGITHRNRSCTIFLTTTNITSLPLGWYYFTYDVGINVAGEQYGVNITKTNTGTNIKFDKTSGEWGTEISPLNPLYGILGLLTLSAIAYGIKKKRRKR